MTSPPNLNMSRVDWGYAWLAVLYLLPGERLIDSEEPKGVTHPQPDPLLTSMKSLSLVSRAVASVSSVLAPSIAAIGDVDSEKQQWEVTDRP